MPHEYNGICLHCGSPMKEKLCQGSGFEYHECTCENYKHWKKLYFELQGIVKCAEDRMAMLKKEEAVKQAVKDLEQLTGKDVKLL